MFSICFLGRSFLIVIKSSLSITLIDCDFDVLCCLVAKLWLPTLQLHGLSLPGSSVPGLFWARILEWVSFSSYMYLWCYPQKAMQRSSIFLLCCCQDIYYLLFTFRSMAIWIVFKACHIMEIPFFSFFACGCPFVPASFVEKNVFVHCVLFIMFLWV